MFNTIPQRLLIVSRFVSIAFGLVLLYMLQNSLRIDDTLSAQSFVRISDIQGSGQQSPLHERWVDTFGIVTGLTEDGFYLQDPVGDGDERTSEGVFVYLNRKPKVKQGDCVLLIRAYVDEFFEKTELSKLKSIEPSERCRTNTVEPVTIPLSRLHASPSELFEAYEGMLVRVESLAGVVQGSTKHFATGESELALTTDTATAELAGGRVFQSQPENSAALIFVSSALGGDLPNLRWGDRIAIGADRHTRRVALAILDYNFGKYQFLLLPDQPIVTETQSAPTPERLAPTRTNEVTICSSNLWALGRGSAQHPNPLDFEREVKKRAKAIAEALFGCAIIGLQEAGSLEAVEALANELRNQYGLDYAAWASSGYQAANVEFPLTTAFLTLKERVDLKSLEMVQSCSPIDYEVLPGEVVCPKGEFLLFDRPTLIADLTVRGDWQTPYRIRVLSNHLKSKGGDETINLPRRLAEARVVAARVQNWLDQDPTAQVVVLGDLNDYYGSQAVEMLRTSVNPALFQVHDLIPYLDRYTYVFNGASQVLDHILISTALQQQLAEVNILHNNSDFAYPETVDLANVIHGSDHDPVAIRLRPNGAATLSGQVGFPGVTVRLLDAASMTVAQQTSDDLGDLRFWNLQPGNYTVQFSAPPYLLLGQHELSIELHTGEQQLSPVDVTHDGLELLRAVFETTPAIMSN